MTTTNPENTAEDVKFNYLTVNKELVKLLTKITGSDFYYERTFWFENVNYCSLVRKTGIPYMHITFSPIGSGKLVGIPFSYLRKEIALRAERKDELLTCECALCLDNFDNELTEQVLYGVDLTSAVIWHSLKPGKIIKALLPNASEQMLAKYGDMLADEIRKYTNPDILVVKESSKPSEIYTLPSAFDSCMSSQPAEYFELYDMLPGTSIAYIVEDGELQGRALIHRGVIPLDANGNLDESRRLDIMDRQYTANSNIAALFKNYAIKNNLLYKTGSDHFMINGKKEELRFIIPTEDLKNRFKHVPYCDSLSLYYCELQVLSNRYNLFDSAQGTEVAYLQNTGGIDDRGLLIKKYPFYCENCNCGLEESEDTIYGREHYCPECATQCLVPCSCGNGFIHRRNYVPKENRINHYCLACQENLNSCRDCGEIIAREDIRCTKCNALRFGKEREQANQARSQTASRRFARMTPFGSAQVPDSLFDFRVIVDTLTTSRN